MYVKNAGRVGVGKESQLANSPSSTQNPLTRLWKGADSSYGHHLEAVADMRERKRREAESRRPRRYREREKSAPDPGVSPAELPSVRVAKRQTQSEHRSVTSARDIVGSPRMSSLRPDDLSVSALPRSPLGHLKTEAVEELLQRAAWDYREVLGQNHQLTLEVDQLTRQVEQLMAEIVSLEEAVSKRKNPDELARTLLASAQRTARAERDAARHEAESTLKKARTRAERVEKDMARRIEQHLDELARLEALRNDVIKTLRASLEEVANRYGASIGEDSEPGDAARLAEARQ